MTARAIKENTADGYQLVVNVDKADKKFQLILADLAPKKFAICVYGVIENSHRARVSNHPTSSLWTPLGEHQNHRCTFLDRFELGPEVDGRGTEPTSLQRPVASGEALQPASE